MRLVLISDTHDWHPTVPDGDVLIHSGDFACGDDLISLRRDIAWLKSLPHRIKILVKGNHDLILNCRPDAAELLRPIHLLENSSIEIEGIKFHGVGWKATPDIPAGTDVVISMSRATGYSTQGWVLPFCAEPSYLQAPKYSSRGTFTVLEVTLSSMVFISTTQRSNVRQLMSSER